MFGLADGPDDSLRPLPLAGLADGPDDSLRPLPLAGLADGPDEPADHLPLAGAAVGRADLLRLLPLAGGRSEVLAVLAELAGFEHRPEATPVPAPRPASVPPAALGPTPVAPPPLPNQAPVTGLSFWRVTAWQSLPAGRPPGVYPDWWQAAVPLAEDLPVDAEAWPAHLPLTPWPRLWPFLRAALGALRAERVPDLARICALAARGRVPRRLPHRQRAHWAPTCQVLLDFSPHLEPVHPDLRALIRPLRRLRGPLGLEMLVTSQGAEGPWTRLPRRGGPGGPPALPPPGTPVLILSDLGCYADAARRAAWVGLGQRLRRAGLMPIALLPCPPRYWDRALAGLYRPVVWDRGRRLPRAPAGARGWPAQPAALAADPGAAQLLDLLAPAIRLDAPLLRALRAGLAHSGSGVALDVGAEAAAWLHPDLARTQPAPQWCDPATSARRGAGHARQPWAARLLAGQLLHEHHRHLPASVWAEEADNLARLLGVPDPAAAAQLAALVRTCAAARGQDQARLHGYAGRFGARQDAAALADDRRAALWVYGNQAALRAGRCALPPGLDLRRVDWLLTGPAAPRTHVLVQRGEGLRATGSDGFPPPPLGAPASAGPGTAGRQPASPQASPLIPLDLTDAPLQYARLGDPERWCSVPADAAQAIPLAPGGLRLRGHDAEVTIKALTRPDWAEAIGCDAAGLYCEVLEGAGSRRLCWVPPGPSLWPAAAPAIRDRVIPHGAWWDAAVYAAWLRGDIASAPWAARTGWDQIGLWAEVDGPRGVTQRLRWLWPGGFLMGSPEQEPEREPWGLDETRHEVLLTRGLWLADTACTQALWRAVMGENPSRFQGPQRPVEQVSWDDVRTFLGRLDAALPGLGLRLPSEAEWEYACRAGTDTPFWFGETITPEQVNYDGNYPYADGAKGLYRAQTVDVKALPANGWGLYQMHGNVWEWCQDWSGAYPRELVIDPVGAVAGGERVVRGGSWIYHAGLCRSAQRFARPPGFRFAYLGFRLARGPDGGPAEPGSGGASVQPFSQAEAGPDRGRGSGIGQALRSAWRRLRG